MNAVTSWFRGHRTLASVVTISLVAGVPLTFAALNPGYPVADVQLTARDVWVTSNLLDRAGRTNTQISQLDGSVIGGTGGANGIFDVLQYGSTTFVDDETSDVLRQVDPSMVTTSTTGVTKLPPAAKVYYDGGVLVIESADGKLWRVAVGGDIQSTYQPLSFDYQTAPSVKIPKLGANAQVNVERDGTVDVATGAGFLYRLDAQTGAVSRSPFQTTGDFELSSVGTEPVVLDLATHRIIEGNGTTRAAPGALQIQLPGDEANYVLLATATGLLRVDLNSGAKTSIPNTRDTPATAGQIAQPVHMGDCDNGVWSNVAYAVYACDGKQVQAYSLGTGLQGDTFKYRVNQTSVALNDLNNGYSWLTGSAKAIDNWNTVPPQQQSPQNGQTKGNNVTYVQKPPTFVTQNNPPVANDDVFGVRAGTTTSLPVLDNDTDPDGDVLSVTSVGAVPASFGVIQLGDGQSPQFTPAVGASGSQTVPYSISDGRGGKASASVKITVVPDNIDNPPVSRLQASLVVEQGQSITYNVLADWRDPDGDAMQLTTASVASGDSVRYTPDGYITFRSVSELGVKKVTYTVRDSSTAEKSATGTLTIDVKAPGTTSPEAESDYASGFVGTPIVVSPLLNDKSPSGQALHLLSVKSLVGSGPSPTLNLDQGTVQFNENQAGSYDFEYTETAGTTGKLSDAFIRVDVSDPPSGHIPPVAVSDVAYLTYPGSVTVPVLDNDISPEGLVLGVQSITAPQLPGITTQLLSNTLVKITATGVSASNQPIVIPYTVSDGTATSSASVTVVAVPQLVNHQSPIAADDFATVRAGEVATVSVLDNDVDPDGAAMSLAPTLVQSPASGLAFVTGNDVRYQAPTTPGQYAAVYSVVDTARESSTARVVFTVTPATARGDRPPAPQPIVSRVFAGGTVRVQVPLAGIDPDGDTVLLQSIPQNPQLGSIVDLTSTYFDYKANQNAGTDTFTYEVTDPFGKTATAPVSIGVIPRAGLLLPTAVDDSATLKPDTSATVDVLANDSDPNGYAISIKPGTLKDLGKTGVNASVVGNNVVLHAGATPGEYNIQYSITDGYATGAVSAVIHATVSKMAVDLPPVAVDHILQQKDVASGKPVNVDARAGAEDPSGVVSELGVTLAGTASPAARISAGHIVVTPGKLALTVGYTLTDPRTKLTSTAFILVPPIPAPGWNLAPYLRKDRTEPVIQINGQQKFALSDLVVAPSGKLPVKIVKKDLLEATHGTANYDDAGDFTFIPTPGYAGPASITFDAADSASPQHSALLTLPVTVGDPSGEDLKPAFTTIQVSVPQGSTTPINLLPATQNSKFVTYTVQGGNSTVSGQTGGSHGSTLSVTTQADAPEGSTVVFNVTLTTPSPSSYVVQGQVIVKVVTTTAPLAQAVTDTANIRRGVTATINVLANDVNPFPDTPLQIVPNGVTIDNSGTGATFSSTSSTVTVTPGPSFIGNISLHYTVEDKTGDTDREVTGEILVTVWDVPDQPAAPTISGFGDGSATIRFNTPTSDNGAPITSYTVRSSPAVNPPTCTAGADCRFTGLSNGTSYVFYVSATNQVGTSQESLASTSVTPYRAPTAPTGANIGSNSASGYAPVTLNMSWGASTDTGGGNVTYHWSLSSGESGNTTSTSVSVYNKGAASYSFTVYAYNPGGNSGTTSSNTVTVSNPPPPTLVISKGAVPPSTSGDCLSTDTDCHFIDVSGANFPANTSVTVSYDTNNGGNGQFTSRTYTTDSSGSFSASDVFYSYSGYQVWVNASGAPQSNTINW